MPCGLGRAGMFDPKEEAGELRGGLGLCELVRIAPPHRWEGALYVLIKRIIK